MCKVGPSVGLLPDVPASISDLCNDPGIAHVHRLTSELQAIAKESGHSRPLLIGIDQENGAFPTSDLAGTYVERAVRHSPDISATVLSLARIG